jgi:hypothetical protein
VNGVGPALGNANLRPVEGPPRLLDAVSKRSVHELGRLEHPLRAIQAPFQALDVLLRCAGTRQFAWSSILEKQTKETLAANRAVLSTGWLRTGGDNGALG